MQLFFRVFLIGLVLLCSCNSGLFVDQKSRPYYFSYKKNSLHKALAAQAQPADSARSAQAAIFTNTASETSETAPGNYALAPASPAGVNSKPTPKFAQPETAFSDRFTRVKTPPAYSKDPGAITTLMPGKTQSDSSLLLGGSLLAALTAGLLVLFQPRARNIAGWAKANKKKSWFLIAVGHLLLGFGGSVLGHVLYRFGFGFSETTTAVLSALFVLTAAAYPLNSAEKGWRAPTFLKSKLASLALLLFGFLLFLNGGNRLAAGDTLSAGATKFEQLTHLEEKVTAPLANTLSATLPSDTPGITSDALAALLFLLAFLLLLGFLFGVAALSCSLACSNQGGAALFVLLFGSALMIYLFVLGFREIEKGAKKRETQRKQKPQKPQLEWF